MLLYWGMFTVGFMVGAIFAYQTFAAKNPEEEIGAIEDDLSIDRTLWGKSQANEFLADNSNRNQSNQITKVDDNGLAVN